MRIVRILTFITVSLIGVAESAVAQIGPGDRAFQCSTNVTVTPNIRGEGYTEPVGDVTLTCTGGIAPALGSVIPQISITLYYNTAVTSRLLPVSGGSNGISEALLLIDEPGSGLPSPAPNFGTMAPQNLCATPLQGCVEYVSQAAGTNVLVATDAPQGTSATTNGKNVFRGIVSTNSVTFFGIPALDPGPEGTRVFRMTNIRVNAIPLARGSESQASPVTAAIAISGSRSVILSNATPTVGFVSTGLTAGVNASANQDQCSSQTKAFITSLAFTENYGTAFKTRVAAQNDLRYAGQNGTPGIGGFAAQNVPGGIYNSESNFFLPIATGQTAGLTDFGTRLKAQFNNVASGVRLFVSTANIQNNGLPVSVPAVIGGSAGNNGTTGYAQLTTDEIGPFSTVAPTGFAPGNSGTVAVAEIPVVNGSASAVWEVINTNPSQQETFTFGVYASYTANWAQNSPLPGTTAVNLSYAATPPAFGAAPGSNASDNLPIPRFIPDNSAARSILTISSRACATTAPTTTTLTAIGNGPYSLTATATTPSPATTGVPVGTVTFFDNGTSIPGGTGAVSAGGVATFNASLPPGPHRLTAQFTPTNSLAFSSSTSPEVLISSGRSSTTLEITSSLYPSLPGQTVTFTAIVTGAGTPPGGIVQFSDGLQSLGSASLAGGRASVTATLTTVGVHNILANYSGDGGNTDSSARYGQRVERVTDSLALAANTPAADAGQTMTLTAALTPQAPAGVAPPTGTVQFQEGTAVVGTSTLTSGSATLAISALAAGVHQIFAIYTGDANWYGVRSPAVTVTINRAATASTLSSSATITELRLTAALTPATAGGSVQFLDNTTNAALGTAQPSNGTATLVLTPSDAAKIGGHNVTAVYSGTAAFAGSTSNILLIPALRNAAGGTSPGFAPEELVSFYGAKLVDATEPAIAAALPQSLGGLSVNITDAGGAVLPAGLSYVSPAQVNFLIPPGLTPGAALVTVVRAGAVVAAVPVTIAPVAPGLFGSQILHTESGATYLVLYGTGIRNRSTGAAVICMVNGTAVPVEYAGTQSAFPGLDQVNLLLPANLGVGALNVLLMVDGQASNTIAVTLQ
uniref:Conserved repeat domain n=1 Tax=Solibacter usitatus (strain Ellin6076) TaxID=234267 RepID=Q01VT3_SOLUE